MIPIIRLKPKAQYVTWFRKTMAIYLAVAGVFCSSEVAVLLYKMLNKTNKPETDLEVLLYRAIFEDHSVVEASYVVIPISLVTLMVSITLILAGDAYFFNDRTVMKYLTMFLFVLSMMQLMRVHFNYSELAIKAAQDSYAGLLKDQLKYPAPLTWNKLQASGRCCGVDGPHEWAELGRYGLDNFPRSCCAPEPELAKEGCRWNKVFYKGCYDKLDGHVRRTLFKNLLWALAYVCSVLLAALAYFLSEPVGQQQQLSGSSQQLPALQPPPPSARPRLSARPPANGNQDDDGASLKRLNNQSATQRPQTSADDDNVDRPSPSGGARTTPNTMSTASTTLYSRSTDREALPKVVIHWNRDTAIKTFERPLCFGGQPQPVAPDSTTGVKTV